MNEKKVTDHRDILMLRVLIGFLGEQSQSSWWPSSFLSRSSDAFLAPIFGQASGVAKIGGVTEAARRAHDAAIGVGRVSHLFRLPEIIEQDLHRELVDSNDLDVPESTEAALLRLGEFGKLDVQAKPGPIRIGPLSEFVEQNWISLAASHYRAAFGAGIQCFPYFSG